MHSVSTMGAADLANAAAAGEDVFASPVSPAPAGPVPSEVSATTARNAVSPAAFARFFFIFSSNLYGHAAPRRHRRVRQERGRPPTHTVRRVQSMCGIAVWLYPAEAVAVLRHATRPGGPAGRRGMFRWPSARRPPNPDRLCPWP